MGGKQYATDVSPPGWATEHIWARTKNLPPTGIRFLVRPARSMSLSEHAVAAAKKDGVNEENEAGKYNKSSPVIERKKQPMGPTIKI